MSERSDSVLLVHRGYLYLGGHIVFIITTRVSRGVHNITQIT